MKNESQESQLLKKTIADTIYQQIGGHRFTAMTGAKDFISLQDDETSFYGLSFKLPARLAKDGIDYIKILLDTSSDTYQMNFGRLNYKAKTLDKAIVGLKKFDNIYFDELLTVFKDVTNLEVMIPSIVLTSFKNNKAQKTQDFLQKSHSWTPQELLEESVVTNNINHYCKAISLGANIMAINNNASLLHLAVMYANVPPAVWMDENTCSPDVLDMMLETTSVGQLIDLENKHGQTALALAEVINSEKAINYLKSYLNSNANIKSLDKQKEDQVEEHGNDFSPSI